MIEHTQSIRFWHHQTQTISDIEQALPRRYRHRRYSQVVASPVPVNYAHWYIPISSWPCPAGPDAPDATQPVPGDEIHEPVSPLATRREKETIWTILEVNISPLTGVWQLVCETYSLAATTGYVNHGRSADGLDVFIREGIAVRHGKIIHTANQKRLTFYIPPEEYTACQFLPDDCLYWQEEQSSGLSSWMITQIERPVYRARWMVIHTEQRSSE